MSQFAYDYESQKLKKYNEQTINEPTFTAWSKENFYRTSYINHFTEVLILSFSLLTPQQKPLEPKNVAVPGYQGFIPGLYSNNEYSKTYSRITRERLANPELGQNPLSLSSTGFNHKKHNFIDPTRTASTHKYGAQTMLATHPCLNVLLGPTPVRTLSFCAGREVDFSKQGDLQRLQVFCAANV